MGRPRLPYDAVHAGRRARRLRIKERMRRKVDAHGALLARVALLRQHKSERRPTGQAGDRPGQLPDLPRIHDRPPEANERVLPGHWEGDVIKGARNRASV